MPPPLKVATTKKLKVQLPAKVRRLIFPSKKLHRVIYGGRSKGASWSIARIILLLCMQQKHYVACVRQVHRSIEKSVYRVLCITIERLNLGGFFRVTSTKIFGKNGSEIFFEGLNNQTQDSIKSLEGATICWVAEAQAISKEGIDILIPTIRGTPEVPPVYFWDLNPVDAYDPAYFMFIVNRRRDTQLCFMSYKDNPWLSNEQLSNIREDYKRDRNMADHIWGGKLRPFNTSLCYFTIHLVLKSMNRNIQYDPGKTIIIGADIAHQGGDSIIFYKCRGPTITEAFEEKYLQFQEILEALEKFANPMYKNDTIINIDNGHGGAMVADAMEDKGWRINRVNFGGAPIDNVHFSNKITELYYLLSKRLELMDIPKDNELLEQLVTRRVEHPESNRGEEQVKLESKKAWGKRENKTHLSPDKADALALAAYIPEEEEYGMVGVLKDAI